MSDKKKLIKEKYTYCNKKGRCSGIFGRTRANNIRDYFE